MLTGPEHVALSQEIDAASSLLRHGFTILDNYRFASHDAEAVFACLGGGTEKLLKLTLGLVCLDDGQPWPTKATMQRAGHKIVELDRIVRARIVQRVERSTAPGLIDQLLHVTDGHPGICQILATLERYADRGRFYNLDLLGGLEHPDRSPQQLWDELEMDIVEANPEMLDQLAGPEHDQVRTDMNKIIAWSLSQWCELLFRAWITGVCGSLAQQCSAQLRLGHPRPRPGP